VENAGRSFQVRSFDDLIRSRQQHRRDSKPKYFRSLHIDDQLKLGRLVDLLK